MKILLAEDDKNLGKLLHILLKKAGMDVIWVEDGEAAYDAVYADGYDVLVLDWMMPKKSGIDLCRQLRDEEYQGKILLLTAKDTLADKVNGLDSGADDYMVKPFEMEELLARLHALGRRQGTITGESIKCGGYTLESSTYCLVHGDDRVELRPREYKLLELLMVNRGQILSRGVLQERVWGIDSDITENNLDVHILRLRKKISQLSDEELICTARGVGYYVKKTV